MVEMPLGKTIRAPFSVLLRGARRCSSGLSVWVKRNLPPGSLKKLSFQSLQSVAIAAYALLPLASAQAKVAFNHQICSLRMYSRKPQLVKGNFNKHAV